MNGESHPQSSSIRGRLDRRRWLFFLIVFWLVYAIAGFQDILLQLLIEGDMIQNDWNYWNKSQAWDAIRSAIFQTTSLKQVRSDMFVSISPGHKAIWITFCCHFLGVFKLGILGDLPKSWGYPRSPNPSDCPEKKIVELAQRRSALAFVLFKLFAVPSVCFVLELVLPLYLTLVKDCKGQCPVLWMDKVWW